VLENYAKNNFPIDVMWLDIPYLDAYADFSVNKTAFPNLPDLGHRLHNNYKRLVVINDAGISADDNSNKYYRKAYLGDALIKSSQFPDNDYHGAVV
jgi:alpha-glucosidase